MLGGHLGRLRRMYAALSPTQRAALCVFLLFQALLALVFLWIGPDRILHLTAAAARALASHPPWGALGLVALVVLVSFPPLVGYGTAITLCGLGWGSDSLPAAWALASSACLLGSTVAFTTLRYAILRNKSHDRVTALLHDPTFAAMATAVRRNGTRMVILIRACPFPFAYSNLFFASLHDAVTLPQLVLATALITPKLLLHVFIGARMAQLMDHDKRAALDGSSRALNVAYIVLGSAVGAGTGWIVWRETQKVLSAMQDQEQVQVHSPDLERHSADGERRPFLIGDDDDDNDDADTRADPNTSSGS